MLTYDETMKLYAAINYLNLRRVRWFGKVQWYKGPGPWSRAQWIILPF